MGPRVKICGITSVEDAEACIALGADALGVNLVPGTRRCVTEVVAADIVRAAARRSPGDGTTRVVLVVANRTVEAMVGLRAHVGASWLQLHGDESPEVVAALLPEAYKAVSVGGPEDVARAAAYGGDLVLVDAKAPGLLGGAGVAFDWPLVADLARRRPLMLAGGLTPDNVAEAVRVVRPAWVDVASGVEAAGDPRRKDPARVRAFVLAARSAT